MRVLAVALALVVGVLALSLVWTNHSQVETIARLREQNGLLHALVEEERQLCVRLATVNRACDHTLNEVAYWLGLDDPSGMGGD